MPNSPITGKPGRLLFEHDVLGRHIARYYLDESIGYIWVDQPTWLEEAYSDAIAITDTGILSRNLANIDTVSFAMRFNGLAEVRSIDLGAGYGLFVRGMRDFGLDFHWSDLYAKNLIARGFEADDGGYEVAAAFEVLEHLENPLGFLREARHKFRYNTLFFSATCFDETNIPGPDWWYWAFETGQHISFFSKRALDFIATELQLHLVHIKGEIFSFTDNPEMAWPNGWQRRQIRRRYKGVSLLAKDYEKMKRRIKGL
ncbi:MAG: class I SAM-dependent methyltransferase [Paracoccaceae bacterium]